MPGQKTAADGWLNRALPREESNSPLRAVSLGPELPHVLRCAGSLRVSDHRIACQTPTRRKNTTKVRVETAFSISSKKEGNGCLQKYCRCRAALSRP
jgi:hypothetical protein